MQTSIKSLAEDEANKPFLSLSMLCTTLGRNPVPLLTITEGVETHLDYAEELRIQKLPSILRRGYRSKYTNARKLAKQGHE